MDLGPKAEMREIRTSGLMSGIWKRDRLGHRARSRLYRAKALVSFSRCGGASEFLEFVYFRCFKADGETVKEISFDGGLSFPAAL